MGEKIQKNFKFFKNHILILDTLYESKTSVLEAGVAELLKPFKPGMGKKMFGLLVRLRQNTKCKNKIDI